jgi:hypothetical protein
MRSGVCPKCHQATVFTKERGVRIGEHMQGVMIPTSMMVMPSSYMSYLCASCGYMENYVVDQAKLAEVAQKWAKVEPPAPGFDV